MLIYAKCIICRRVGFDFLLVSSLRGSATPLEIQTGFYEVAVLTVSDAKSTPMLREQSKPKGQGVYIIKCQSSPKRDTCLRVLRTRPAGTAYYRVTNKQVATNSPMDL